MLVISKLWRQCVHASRRLRGGISETCDRSLCCHVTSCFGLGSDFAFEPPHRVHLFCQLVLSVPIVQIVHHCLPIPLPLFCYKMVLKTTCLSFITVITKHRDTHLKEACFDAIPPLLVKFWQRGFYFHVISFKQPVLNQWNSGTVKCTPASCQQLQRFVHAIYLYMDTLPLISAMSSLAHLALKGAESFHVHLGQNWPQWRLKYWTRFVRGL